MRTLEKEVLKGDIDSFDQWIVYLNDNYGRMLEANNSNVNNEIATWTSVSDSRYGMSLLQIAVWGGHPEMVKRVLDVCMDPTVPTNFDIEYRKKKNPAGMLNPEIDPFDGKTAREIADNMLKTIIFTEEEKRQYAQILNMLVNSQGRRVKYSRTRGLRGIQNFVGAVLPGVFSGGKRTYRKKRKTNRRKTRRHK